MLHFLLAPSLPLILPHPPFLSHHFFSSSAFLHMFHSTPFPQCCVLFLLIHYASFSSLHLSPLNSANSSLTCPPPTHTHILFGLLSFHFIPLSPAQTRSLTKCVPGRVISMQMCVYSPPCVSDNILINSQKRMKESTNSVLCFYSRPKRWTRGRKMRKWWKLGASFEQKCLYSRRNGMPQSSVGQVCCVISTADEKNKNKIKIPLCPACLFASVCAWVLGEISLSKPTSETFPFSLLPPPISSSLLCMRMEG